jgi:hypothetical protein
VEELSHFAEDNTNIASDASVLTRPFSVFVVDAEFIFFRGAVWKYPA